MDKDLDHYCDRFGPLYQLKVLLMDTADSAIVRQTAGVVFDMWQKFAFTVRIGGFLCVTVSARGL